MAFQIMKTRLEWCAEAKRPASGQVLLFGTSDHLWMVAGPALDLKKELGKSVELEAVRQGPVEPGQVVGTPGGEASFHHLCHAAVVGQDGAWVQGACEAAARAAVVWATRERIGEMVVWPFHRGLHIPKVDAAKELLRGLLKELESGSSLVRIQVIVSDPEEQQLFQALTVQLLGDSR